MIAERLTQQTDSEAEFDLPIIVPVLGLDSGWLTDREPPWVLVACSPVRYVAEPSCNDSASLRPGLALL